MPDFPRTGGGATAVEVWNYATRQLNADGANAIRDAIISDATRIPGANIDQAVSSRAAIADYTAARAAKIDKVQDFVEEASGTLTATGAEDIIKEITDTTNKLHCFIDLTAMQAGDEVIIRQWMKVKAAGSYIKYAEEVFNDVQTLPMLYVVTKPARHGIKITLQQTAAPYRDYDWETFQEKAA